MVKDYASLTQAILDFSHNDALIPYTDYFIQGAEDRIYRKILLLNEGSGIKAMEATLSGTIDATTGYVTVPTDYLAMKDAILVASEGSFQMVTKESGWIYDNYPTRTAQGIPAYIAREGANFIFGPFPDSSYTIAGTYYSRATALSSGNTTTWMTTNIPMTLLSACMVEVSKFLKDPAAAQQWMGEMTDHLTDICAADKADRYGNGTLVMDAA